MTDKVKSGSLATPHAPTVSLAAPRPRVKVIIYPAEEGGFSAEVPALPGCFTEADTREELLANLREAIEGCLLAGSGVPPTEEGGHEEEIEL